MSPEVSNIKAKLHTNFDILHHFTANNFVGISQQHKGKQKGASTLTHRDSLTRSLRKNRPYYTN